jgi:DNA-binding NtrC family response regulator
MAFILIVDDDQHVRKMLIQMMEIEGFKVEAAADGNEAIKKFNENPPDLVITDIVMPDKEGLEIIRYFINEKPEIKVIAISGGAFNIEASNTLKIAKALGAYKTFTKPVSRSQLVSAVKAGLSK